MRATAILVRWQGGWRWVEDATEPRIEISQGHSGDSAEVVAKAGAELVTYGAGQTEITVAVDERTTWPVWGVDLIVGDEVNVDGAWREIEAFTAQLAGNGRWMVVPQFGAILDAPEDRIRRTVRNIGGLNGGTSHLARPVASLPPVNVRPG